MDSNEEALGKISRQLSELAATSASSALTTGTASPVDGSWTQFSGISPQAGHSSFRNLYTWNPMDLPDFKPLSPPKVSAGSSPSQPLVNTTGLVDHRNFLAQNQPHFQDDDCAQRFHVSGDLAGRLMDISREQTSRPNFDSQNLSYLGQNNSQKLDHVFHTDRSASGEVLLHQFMPHSPSSSLAPENPGRFTPPDAFVTYAGPPILMPDVMHRMNLTSGCATDRSIQEVPVDSSPHAHLFHTPPVFDPHTPPPNFMVQGHHSVESQQPSSVSPKPTLSHPDSASFLRQQGKTNINLDLGINIDRGNKHHISEGENIVSANDKGCKAYESSVRQCHPFESSLDSSPPQPLTRQDSASETVATDSSKPSYSDIAKMPKSGPGAGVKPDQPGFENTGKVLGLKSGKKDGKPFRPSVKRTASGSKFWPKGSASDADQPRMSPTSKYGLDNFDDHVFGPGGHSSSAENLMQPSRGRRGSGSSAGSSISALDEITTGASETDIHRQRRHSRSQDQKQSGSSKSASSMKPPSDSSQSFSEEPLFFDPRRIFQTKNTNKSRVQANSKPQVCSSGAGLDEFGVHPSFTDTVLNNGKPTASHSSSKLSSSARQHDYINNDLRDSSKRTNQTAAENVQGASSKVEELHRQREPQSGKKSGGRTNGVYRRDVRKSTDNNSRREEEPSKDNSQNHNLRLSQLAEHVNREKLEEWFSVAWEKLGHWGSVFLSCLLTLLAYMLGLLYYLAIGAVHLAILLLGKSWFLIRGFFSKDEKAETNRSFRDSLRRRVGLEENISLPKTGEEAMKRLLACKGKDPYSILGLRADSSDEDIKKYYRKQAVLVHPDKNQEPGAEEAFKILGHAFEMIGEPTKRRQYDSHTQEADEADAMREFAEMLSKLHTKIQEAANIMHCDSCGGKHRRVFVDRPFYSARFCERCNTRHSAKEGDVWAESTVLGFYWHYYALMDEHVYDITEWMKCHKDYFKHMQANAHGVMYRIETDGSRRGRHQQSRETDLEDFINKLFQASSTSAGDGHGPSWGHQHAGSSNSWGQGAAAAAATKRGRKKKKRH